MFKLRVVLCAWAVALPTLALAQGTAGISGQVKDATGGVLPGVTVEASSPALIEKTRVATTDGAGEFKIVSLPPGAYTISFSLTGFSSVRREGIVLTTGFTATVDAELRVGAVEETITVSGDSPLVDVQNVKRQVVMTREMVDTLPTGKTAVEMATLIPGVQLMNGTGAGAAATGMGGSLGMDQFATLAAHGSRPADTRLEVNGVNINIFGQRQDSTYANFQDGNVQEYSFEISAHSAESETGGVRVTIVPKDGGNRYSGQFFANFANENFQSTNMTPELTATGLRDPDRTVSLWTVNPSLGGPVVRDRLWFYGGYSRMVNERLKAGTYFNTDLAAWRPTFDTSRQATALEETHDTNIRLTWQAAAKHKVSFYYANNRLCQCPYLIGATYVGINAPEGATMAPRTTNLTQVNWTAPLTNRVLAEASVSFPRYTKGHDVYVVPLEPRIVEQSNGVGFRGPNPSLFFDDENKTPVVKGTLSYVTGTHALKAGTTYRHATAEQFYEVFQDLTFTTNNYRPVLVQYQATPYYPKANEKVFGLFAQDQWTLGDLTMNLGLRYDYYEQGYPDIHLPATRWVPLARNFPAATLVGWKDLSPRIGAAYDLFGNGRTAIKGSISRYNVQGLFLNDQNPARANVTMQRQLDRSERRLHHPGGSVQPGDQRRAGREPEPQLRPRDHPVQLRSRLRVRLGCPSLQLGDVDLGAARADARRVAQRVVSPPRLRQLPGERQPARGAHRLQPVQRHGAERFTASGWRRLPNHGAVRSEQQQGRPEPDDHDLVVEVRRANRAVERCRRVGAGSSVGRRSAAGRRQHRQDDDRQLRRRSEARQPQRPLLPQRDTVLAAVQVRRRVHATLGDRAVGDDPELHWPSYPGERDVHERTDAAVAWPSRCRRARP